MDPKKQIRNPKSPVNPKIPEAIPNIKETKIRLFEIF